MSNEEKTFSTFLKGVTLLEHRRFKGARTAFGRVLGEMPTFAPAYNGMAVSYMQEEDFQTALGYAQKALEHAPDESSYHLTLGLVWAGLDALENGIQCIESAVELSPNNADYHAHLAGLLIQAKIYGKAQLHLEQALQLNPQQEQALGLSSFFNAEFGRKDQAAEYMGKALSVNPNNPGLHLIQANQLFDARKFEQAAYHYQYLLLLEPGDQFYKERCLDSLLGLHAWYYWLAIKFRAHYRVPHATLFFDLFLIFLGGAAVRKVGVDGAFYPYIWWTLFVLLIHGLLFWGTRFFGHLFMAGLVWGVKRKHLVDQSTYMQLNASLALVSAIIHLFTLDFLWLGTASIMSILGCLSWGYGMIEDARKKRFFIAYIVFLYAVGALSFGLEISGFAKKNYAADLLIASIFVPVLVLGAWNYIMDIIKARKSSVKPLPKKSRRYTRPKEFMRDFVTDFALLPVFLALLVVWNYWGINILQIVKFAFIWGGISVLLTLLFYKQLKKRKSQLLDIEHSFQNAEEAMNKVLRVTLTVFLVVLLMGMVMTTKTSSKTVRQEKVAIMEHGHNASKKHAFLYVKYKGKKTKIRPSNQCWKETITSDSVTLEVRKGLFHIEVVEAVLPILK